MKRGRSKYKVDDDSIGVEQDHVNGCYFSRAGIVRIIDDDYGTSMYFVWNQKSHSRRFKPHVPFDEQYARAEAFVREVLLESVSGKGKK